MEMIKKYNQYIKEDKFEHITTPEDEIVAFFTQHPKFDIPNMTDTIINDEEEPSWKNNYTYYEIRDAGAVSLPYLMLTFTKSGNIHDPFIGSLERKINPSNKEWVRDQIDNMESNGIPRNTIIIYKDIYKLLSEWI